MYRSHLHIFIYTARHGVTRMGKVEHLQRMCVGVLLLIRFPFNIHHMRYALHFLIEGAN